MREPIKNTVGGPRRRYVLNPLVASRYPNMLRQAVYGRFLRLINAQILFLCLLKKIKIGFKKSIQDRIFTIEERSFSAWINPLSETIKDKALLSIECNIFIKNSDMFVNVC